MVIWHSLLEYILLLAIFTGGQTHLLLPLIVHHFLHHAACLSIQIGQFRWLRIDFTCWDFRITCYQTIPPVHAIDLLECDQHRFAVLQHPNRFLLLDLAAQLTIDDRLLTFEAHLQWLLANADHNVAGAQCERHVERNLQLQLEWNQLELNELIILNTRCERRSKPTAEQIRAES